MVAVLAVTHLVITILAARITQQPRVRGRGRSGCRPSRSAATAWMSRSRSTTYVSPCTSTSAFSSGSKSTRSSTSTVRTLAPTATTRDQDSRRPPIAAVAGIRMPPDGAALTLVAVDGDEHPVVEHPDRDARPPSPGRAVGACSPTILRITTNSTTTPRDATGDLDDVVACAARPDGVDEVRLDRLPPGGARSSSGWPGRAAGRCSAPAAHGSVPSRARWTRARNRLSPRVSSSLSGSTYGGNAIAVARPGTPPGRTRTFGARPDRAAPGHRRPGGTHERPTRPRRHRTGLHAAVRHRRRGRR